MTAQSHQLEAEAEQTRAELAEDLDELRARLTPGQIADEVLGYMETSVAGDFFRSLVREVKQHPLPLLVIFAGIAWAVAETALARRPAAAPPSTRVAPPPEPWQVAPLDELVERA